MSKKNKQPKTSSKTLRADVAPKISHAPATKAPSHEEIALHAFDLWEAAGRPHGQHVAHWAAAEAALRS